VKKEELKEFFAQSYGIFAGKPKGKVVLKFKPEIARWVASEEWHPDQEEKTEADGTYILTFPYSDERELAADIMKYGDGVEVVGPADLRKLVKQKLKAAAGQYK